MKYLMSFFFGILALFLLSLHFIYKSNISTKGNQKLTGLKSEVKVFRDKNGIPHIEAANNKDAYRALGFIQASDRLFQMELLRRIGSGRLSELLGKKLLETDVLLRSLRLKKTAIDIVKRNFENWPNELKEETTAFLEGVNEFARSMPLPLEFIVLGITPEPFTLEDSIAISGYMALSFAEGLLIDPLHSDLSDELSSEKMKELFIETNADKNTIKKVTSTNYFKNMRKAISALEENFGLFHGSNSWVLSGSKSVNGKPILCNDPHVAFSLPGIWYEAHIKTPTLELYGYYVPLSPYTPMGNNKDVGWAVTMAEVDDLDLYEEKINGAKVLYKNKWVDLKIEAEEIKIKDESSYKFDLKISPHGPLLDESKFKVKGKSIALAWSYHHPKNDMVKALFKLTRAKNVGEFNEAVSHGGAPGLNLSWVDSSGDIAWKIMALIPIRPKGVNSKQILEGWHGEHDYIGYIDTKENPGLINPPEGFIATANYIPIYNGPHKIPGYYQASERYERIEKKLKANNKWDLKSLKEFQTDQFVETANWMLPIVTNNIKSSNKIEKAALEILKKWKGKSGRESRGSTIYHLLSLHIIRNTILDELGMQRFKSFSRTADIWHFYKTILRNKHSLWWNNIKTEAIDSMNSIIQLSFEQTILKLQKDFGEKPSTWNWGRLHTLEYPHPFGKKKPLDKLFNRGPFPAGGGFFQIDNMSNNRSDLNFNITIGPSVRRIIDFADPLNSHNILPSGNSGNIISPFYDDQIKMFLDGKYREASLNWDWIKKNSTLLKLSPR